MGASDKNPAANSEKAEPVLVSVKGVSQFSHLPALLRFQGKGEISLGGILTGMFNKTFPGRKDLVFQTRLRFSFPRWFLWTFTLSPSDLGSWLSQEQWISWRQAGNMVLPGWATYRLPCPISVHWKSAARNLSTPWTSPDRQHLALWLMAFPFADHTLSRGCSNPQ